MCESIDVSPRCINLQGNFDHGDGTLLISEIGAP